MTDTTNVHLNALLDYREAFWQLNEAVSALLHNEACNADCEPGGCCSTCVGRLEDEHTAALEILRACAHCGRPAVGYASAMDDRLCHDGVRDCYSRHGSVYGRPTPRRMQP